MALVIVVTAGAQLGEGEEISREFLNRLGLPTITLQGLVDQVVIADGAVTTPKLGAAAVTGPKIALLAIDNTHIAAAAAIALSKLAAGAANQIVACLPGGALQFANAAGEVAGQTCQKLPFDNLVADGLSAGQVVRGKTSGETGVVVAIEMVGASDGWLILKDCSGDTWADNEDLDVLNEVEYDGLVDGKSFTAGDAVLGAASGATGIILSKTGTRLVLRQATGTWLDDEGLRVNGDASNTALANGPHAIRAKVDLSGGKVFGDAAYYALQVNRTIFGADVLDRALATRTLKPEGTAGQLLVSRGLQLSPSFQTVNFKPAAMVNFTDTYAGRVNTTWQVASYSAVGDTLTFAAGVTMAEIADGDVVCFSGPTGNIPTNASRGVRYYLGDKDAGAKTCKLYTDVARTVVLDLGGAGGAIANVYLHKVIATGFNCSLAKDTDDAGGQTDKHAGYYQVIYHTALGTVNQVLTGTARGYLNYPTYSMGLGIRETAVAYLRFHLMYADANTSAAERLGVAVFENA